ncbi:MAG: amidase domain-containing protein [Oscillospiraceae bacterium]|nr:amidase domain-containing protein [Oscillospiraceae bacterium]
MIRYDRGKAVSYAHRWAFRRNASYYDFSNIGGDCTNFCSQCLYAGCGMMNYTPDVGWFYGSPDSRAAAWSGVEFLYKFLTTNRGDGPFASDLPLRRAQIGDIIQLSFDGAAFVHSLLVVHTRPEILVSTHTMDSDNRALSSYTYEKSRLLHILGARG